jgi:hypothetical protein
MATSWAAHSNGAGNDDWREQRRKAQPAVKWWWSESLSGDEFGAAAIDPADLAYKQITLLHGSDNKTRDAVKACGS